MYTCGQSQQTNQFLVRLAQQRNGLSNPSTASSNPKRNRKRHGVKTSASNHPEMRNIANPVAHSVDLTRRSQPNHSSQYSHTAQKKNYQQRKVIQTEEHKNQEQNCVSLKRKLNHNNTHQQSQHQHKQRQRHRTAELIDLKTSKKVPDTRFILENCSWQEKTVHVARSIFGTSSSNGFLKATAASQRIKKQIVKKIMLSTNEEKQKILESQEGNEKLKSQIMDVQTVKRLRNETMKGIEFCLSISSLVKSVIADLEKFERKRTYFDNAASMHLQKLENTAANHVPNVSLAGSSSTKFDRFPLVGISNQCLENDKTANAKNSSEKTNNSGVSSSFTFNSKSNSFMTKGIISSAMPSKNTSNALEAGNPNGSTLRKLRMNNSLSTQAEEFTDENGRKLSKREWSYQLSEISRIRSLNKGDYVAAKVECRDMYIVARVVEPYIAPDEGELKQLNVPEREVLIQDVEDYDADPQKAKAVARNLILSLPRSYAEALEWGLRFRKASRVYAMYPSTTSLYAATVVDSTTYCRGEDDIIVVEFDGDEDELGKLPQRHIPARFVTRAPRETSKKKMNSKKFAATSTSPQKSRNATPANVSQNQKCKRVQRIASNDALNKMVLDLSNTDDDCNSSESNLGQETATNAMLMKATKIVNRRKKEKQSSSIIGMRRGRMKGKGTPKIGGLPLRLVKQCKDAGQERKKRKILLPNVRRGRKEDHPKPRSLKGS